ncbi:efflux RND transporter periplasmic adaptor subunit [Lujinxingia vulgaris]|uniref:Efflux RND transporter periplasmic adaptor subunit n=1 Tax=Lujinxingia vulgaris TaxID=2600176 RepID=A0A5C6XBQ0_9DELT|nr:efflux RND transporter periplasmic adaptor subunit [Lujinxingia vulgaris]TXD34789.1 efflux RND transporter periplasmic adaptor subunit [Lujinxingia vulgaris]
MSTPRPLPDPETIERTLARSRRGRLPLWVGSTLVVGGIIASVAWWQWPREEPIHWQTRPAERGDIIVSASATGTVEARRTVTIGAEISGKLATVDVDKNEEVEVGQVLATFDTTVLESQLALARAGLASSQASLRRARASLDEAEGEERRTRALVEREVGALAELEAAIARTLRARADLDQSRADLQRARAQVDDVQTQLERATITSPIDGVILARHVEPGMTVASSLQAPELFLAAEDLAKMRLQVWVDEADVGLVKPGQQATFTVSAWPGQTFDATVESLDLAPTLTENVVTYVAELSVDNSERLLRPGMSAAVTIVTETLTDVLRVPNAALRFTPPAPDEDARPGGGLLPRFGRWGGRGGGAAQGVGTVYVLENGMPTELRVHTGRSDGRFTQITSGELEDGTELLIGFTEGPPPEREGLEGKGDRSSSGNPAGKTSEKTSGKKGGQR